MIFEKEHMLKLHLFEHPKNNHAIYFQEMIHIGSIDFYKNVNQEIKSFIEKSNGVVLIEGVKGKEEEIENLNILMFRKLGYQFEEVVPSLKDVYKFFVTALHLEAQSDNIYLKDISEQHIVKADIEALKLIKILDTLEEKKTLKTITKKDVEDGKNNLNKLFKFGLLRILAKLFLKIMIKRKKSIRGSGLIKIILNDRNKVLLDFIENHKEKDQFITYGAAHFEEIKEELIKNGYQNKVVKIFNPF